MDKTLSQLSESYIDLKPPDQGPQSRNNLGDAYDDVVQGIRSAPDAQTRIAKIDEAKQIVQAFYDANKVSRREGETWLQGVLQESEQ